MVFWVFDLFCSIVRKTTRSKLLKSNPCVYDLLADLWDIFHLSRWTHCVIFLCLWDILHLWEEISSCSLFLLFNFSLLFSLSHVYLFLPLSCCLLPHRWLNYPLLGFRVCNWYFWFFDLNYIGISFITLLWSLFVIYLCMIW
jgi:hypothetical protein